VVGDLLGELVGVWLFGGRREEDAWDSSFEVFSLLGGEVEIWEEGRLWLELGLSRPDSAE
jgi:hypothetical protein